MKKNYFYLSVISRKEVIVQIPCELKYFILQTFQIKVCYGDYDRRCHIMKRTRNRFTVSVYSHYSRRRETVRFFYLFFPHLVNEIVGQARRPFIAVWRHALYKHI